MTDTHDHDHGLKHDLPRLIGRRRALALLGVGGGLAMASPANALMCVADQWETAGPYPADGTNSKAGQTVNVLTQEGVIRHDIRPSFGGHSPDVSDATGRHQEWMRALGRLCGLCVVLRCDGELYPP